MKSETIYLEKQAIAFRDDAKEIEKLTKKVAKKYSIVYLDFSEVKFISRSFADELINVQEKLKEKGVSLRMKNTASNVRQMITLVRMTRRKILRQTGSFKIYG